MDVCFINKSVSFYFITAFINSIGKNFSIEHLYPWELGLILQWLFVFRRPTILPVGTSSEQTPPLLWLRLAVGAPQYECIDRVHEAERSRRGWRVQPRSSKNVDHRGQGHVRQKFTKRDWGSDLFMNQDFIVQLHPFQ